MLVKVLLARMVVSMVSVRSSIAGKGRAAEDGEEKSGFGKGSVGTDGEAECSVGMGSIGRCGVGKHNVGEHGWPYERSQKRK